MGVEYETAVREIAEKTRQPVSKVLNTLVGYALEHVELQPVSLYEMIFQEEE